MRKKEKIFDDDFVSVVMILVILIMTCCFVVGVGLLLDGYEDGFVDFIALSALVGCFGNLFSQLMR